MDSLMEPILKLISKRVQFVVVVDKNGLPITSFDTKTRKKIDPSLEMMIAGIAAAVLTLGEKTSTMLNHGELKEFIIKNEEGTTVILDAGEQAILIAILPSKTSYDAPLISLKRAAGQIAKLKGLISQEPPKPSDPSDIFIPEID